MLDEIWCWSIACSSSPAKWSVRAPMCRKRPLWWSERGAVSSVQGTGSSSQCGRSTEGKSILPRQTSESTESMSVWLFPAKELLTRLSGDVATLGRRWTDRTSTHSILSKWNRLALRDGKSLSNVSLLTCSFREEKREIESKKKVWATESTESIRSGNRQERLNQNSNNNNNNNSNKLIIITSFPIWFQLGRYQLETRDSDRINYCFKDVG